MNHRQMTTQVLLFTMAALGVMIAGAAAAQTDTTFTYQGRLLQDGAPVNGGYNMEFTLWDAQADGNQVGPTLDVSADIADGLFTVDLDFGAGAFNNFDRWLQIVVESQTLSPRQPITRAPYALQTRGIYVDPDNRVGIGTIAPVNPLHVVGPDNNGSDAGLRIQSSTQHMLLDGNEIDTNSSVGLYLNNNVEHDVIIANGGGDVGIGTTTPGARLHVQTPSGHSIVGETTNSSGSSWAVRGRSASTSGIGVIGVAIAQSGRNYGVIGASSSASGFDFYAAGAGTNYGASSSIRWKKNIEPIDDPLSKLAQLRGVYFDWDQEHGGHHDVGMIAEEVGAVLPEIVNYEENKIDAIGMDYSKLTPLLVEAINALRAEKDAQIVALQEENTELRERLAELESSVAQLAAEAQK